VGRGSDCQQCAGADVPDCKMCGGSGWNPPARDPDRRCVGCGRALWYGGRGPMWFAHLLDEHDDAPLCKCCVEKKGTRGSQVPKLERRSIRQVEEITL